ncbi:MAG: urate hydroxylase PuuD [Proteobacteria bacterium]|uniref:urate hydroxylase PuuD n=1 Tax=Thauera sp. 2A1 TaxID=2570191 RepID=UPI00129093E4|nr:urate hydroxylase PuuD [Thauera sp. 2A1]KAI5913481.1 urate hydroxylase PuuD [Thauera sp. 2A1]MBS0510847.1 urate hydroxylase PuuD [Pseudomonadota bacterium]MBS0551197.1 urate hydroxylase PuuD [Pseudomonadota bacterium]
METYLLDWANLLVRWLHLIAGIAWIGASFYFVMLDNSLKAPKNPNDAKRGVFGELWAVHGGGFYHSQKYLTGPKGEPLTEDLHWSKWEAYTTWLSGMGMLAIVYWIGASSYLIDSNVMALTPAAAVGISIAFLISGWVFYDILCRNMIGKDGLLAAIVFVFVMAANYLLHHVFSARGAYIHVGAMLGTMMAANVFFHIIPGQKKMVEQIRRGEAVDSMPGIVGKQRSVHNTYFTLPVLFIMISNHYPMTYANKHGWLILGVVMLAGVLIRQFFVLRHRGQVKTWLPAAGAALLALLVVVMAPKQVDAGGEKVSFATVKSTLEQRCVTCHAAQPKQEGFAQPPKGVMLETPEQIAQHAAKIAETVASGYMPLGNLTQITDKEREAIAIWYAQGARLKD